MYRQMIERIARIRGKRLPIVEVPVLTPRLSSWWLHLVTPVNASVARPLIDGLRTPTIVRDDGRIRESSRSTSHRSTSPSGRPCEPRCDEPRGIAARLPRDPPSGSDRRRASASESQGTQSGPSTASSWHPATDVCTVGIERERHAPPRRIEDAVGPRVGSRPPATHCQFPMLFATVPSTRCREVGGVVEPGQRGAFREERRGDEPVPWLRIAARRGAAGSLCHTHPEESLLSPLPPCCKRAGRRRQRSVGATGVSAAHRGGLEQLIIGSCASRAGGGERRGSRGPARWAYLERRERHPKVEGPGEADRPSTARSSRRAVGRAGQAVAHPAREAGPLGSLPPQGGSIRWSACDFPAAAVPRHRPAGGRDRCLQRAPPAGRRRAPLRGPAKTTRDGAQFSATSPGPPRPLETRGQEDALVRGRALRGR